MKPLLRVTSLVLVIFGTACDMSQPQSGPSAAPALEESAAENATLALKVLSPSTAKAGEGFHKQQDGKSALGVTAENATTKTAIYLDGQKLATTFGSATFLSAVVPDDVISKPGNHEVYLSDGKRQSNKLQLTIE